MNENKKPFNIDTFSTDRCNICGHYEEWHVSKEEDESYAFCGECLANHTGYRHTFILDNLAYVEKADDEKKRIR